MSSKTGKLWFMTYSWVTTDGRVLFAESVEKKHPLEVIIGWQEDLELNEEYRLINFWEIPEKLKERYLEAF